MTGFTQNAIALVVLELISLHDRLKPVIQENEVYVIVFEGSSSAGTAPDPAVLCPQLPSTLNENGIAAAPQ